MKVIRAVADLANRYQVAPGAGARETLPSMGDMLADGQLATYISGSYTYIDLATGNPSIGIAPLPMFDRPVAIGLAACCEMSAATEHPEEVFDFLRWYIEADTNPCHIASNLPNEYRYYEDESLYDVWMDPELYSEDYRMVVPELMADYSSQPEMCVTKNAAQIFEEYVEPVLDTVWTGQSSAQDAVRALGKSVMTVYEGRW